MIKNIKPLVSIVVPVYNVEQFLSACVDSLLAQTYNALEIVLVDDGSTDRSSELCDKYEQRFANVKVIHRVNGGLSDARNTGIVESSADYICFVDGDDIVAPHYIEVLYETLRQNDADISCCGYQVIAKEHIWGVREHVQEADYVYNNYAAVVDVFSAPSRLGVMAWNKLYKKSLFVDNSIRYPLGKIHEDNFTTYKLLYNAKKIAYTKEKLYGYVQRQGSIMSTTFRAERLDVIGMFNEARQYLAIDNHLNIDVVRAVDSFEMITLLWLYSDFVTSSNRDILIASTLRRRLDTVIHPLCNPITPNKYKVQYLLVRFMPWLSHAYILVRTYIRKGSRS